MVIRHTKERWRVGLVVCMLLLCFFASLAGEIKVQANVDTVDLFENAPIPVTIMVTHPAAEGVDVRTFTLGKEPVEVEKVQEVGDPAHEDMLSIYRLRLPGLGKGLHMLPAVSVTIGGSVYRSIATTFEIKARNRQDIAPARAPRAPSTTASAASAVSSAGAFLKLENIIQGSTAVFLGETVIVGYRYSYNADIETTQEVTPLFEVDGFSKVGDKIIRNKQASEVSILEVTQQLQAEREGTFSAGPSTLEGYVYTQDSSGKRTYSKSPLKATAPVVTFTIKALPEKQPASFNGAIGKYTFQVVLVSSNKVTVGDEMTLEVSISGTGDLNAIKLPELCCQPGMSGLFKLKDLPPVGRVNGAAKMFTVNLRPLNTSIRSIPSLEFSFFNPTTKQYEVVRSAEIPITVSELAVDNDKSTVPSAPKEEEAKDWLEAMNKPEAIDVPANYPLEEKDLQNKWFSSWWMLFLIPLGLGLLFYQYNLKKFLSSLPKVEPIIPSETLFQEAWQEESHSPLFYEKLYRAFFLRLEERKDIESSINSIEKLPSEGASGDVKALLMALEESRYTEKTGAHREALFKRAEQLFAELEIHS